MMFADDAALRKLYRIMSDPKVNRVLIEDEVKFLDHAAIVMMTCEVVDTGTTR